MVLGEPAELAAPGTGRRGCRPRGPRRAVRPRRSGRRRASCPCRRGAGRPGPGRGSPGWRAGRRRRSRSSGHRRVGVGGAKQAASSLDRHPARHLPRGVAARARRPPRRGRPRASPGRRPRCGCACGRRRRRRWRRVAWRDTRARSVATGQRIGSAHVRPRAPSTPPLARRAGRPADPAQHGQRGPDLRGDRLPAAPGRARSASRWTRRTCAGPGSTTGTTWRRRSTPAGRSSRPATCTGRPERLHLFSARAERSLFRVPLRPGRLPGLRAGAARAASGLLAAWPDRCVSIPMLPGQRSLNLAVSVGVGVYGALRSLSE